MRDVRDTCELCHAADADAAERLWPRFPDLEPEPCFEGGAPRLSAPNVAQPLTARGVRRRAPGLPSLPSFAYMASSLLPAYPSPSLFERPVPKGFRCFVSLPWAMPIAAYRCVSKGMTKAEIVLSLLGLDFQLVASSS